MDPEIIELLTKQGDAFATFKRTHDAALATERKEREELEKKLNRMTLGGAGGAGDAETKAIAVHTALGDLAKTGGISDEGVKAEVKAMSVGSDPGGGYVVYPEVSSGWTEKLWDLSPMRRLARGIVLTSGDAWEEPIDADEADATWVGEQTSRPETDTPDMGKLRIPLHEIYAMPKITQKLLDTASVDVGAWLEGKITDKFGRSEGVAFVTGDGVAKPRGFLSYDVSTAVDASRPWGTIQYIATGVSGDFAAADKADKLIDLSYSLRAPYRSGAQWMMNSNTAGIVRKFKVSGTGTAYLWQDSLVEGAPAMLAGYPVAINEDMPDPGANTFSVAFGNWQKAYAIVDLAGVRILRDPYSAKPNVLFYAYKRVGGGLDNSEAVKLLKFGTS